VRRPLPFRTKLAAVKLPSALTGSPPRDRTGPRYPPRTCRGLLGRSRTDGSPAGRSRSVSAGPGGTFQDRRALLERRSALLTDDRLASKQVRMSSLIGPDIRVYQLCREVIDREVEPDEDETDADSGDQGGDPRTRLCEMPRT